MRDMVLVPFWKQNTFNNSRKVGKFGIGLVDSIVNTLWTLELANVFQLFTSVPCEAQLLFNDLCTKPL